MHSRGAYSWFAPDVAFSLCLSLAQTQLRPSFLELSAISLALSQFHSSFIFDHTYTLYRRKECYKYSCAVEAVTQEYQVVRVM